MSIRSFVAGAVLGTLAPLAPLAAQLIQVKTLPIADGDQWRFFPSANIAMGGLSIALSDSLLDPFVNPALGGRGNLGGRGSYFASPAVYSVSHGAGGGQTFPIGGIVRSGSTFGGLALAVQEIDRPTNTRTSFVPPGLFNVTGSDVVVGRQNRFAFATVGRVLPRHAMSIGASVLWSGLRNVDGVDLLYAGSSAIAQRGDAVDVRVGLSKEWPGRQTFDAILLRNRFSMAHDVTWADQFFDPNTRATVFRPRVDHNVDRTETWGVHLAYSRPLADSGWRIGGILTSNLMSHPKLPDYQIAQVMVIPWDPGHTAAYDIGVGVARSHGPTTFGIDAVYEPIVTHTWGETPSPIETPSGATIPSGGKTTENHFDFSNAIVRAGVGRDLDLGHGQALRLQMGLALRSIRYSLDQTDHVAETRRVQDESWLEWTRNWGLSLRFSDLELRYTGRMSTGTGRPGIVSNVFAVPGLATVDSNIISAPNGPLTLTAVSVTTHQLSVSLPIR